jgi:hypothetical protein
MQVGLKIDYDPIPPIEKNTERFRAGAITFAVEYRELTNDLMTEQFGKDLSQIPEYKKAFDLPDQMDDTGVSIHVFGDDGREYLRFDCFLDDPHYHYVHPDEPWQVIVPMDIVANGDPLAWSLACIRGRLVPMLDEAGGAHIAERVDTGLVRKVSDQVEQAARRITKQAA